MRPSRGAGGGASEGPINRAAVHESLLGLQQEGYSLDKRLEQLDERASGAAPLLELPLPLRAVDTVEDSAVNCRFWIAFAAVFFVFLNSGFVGGYTSPVLAVDCGDGSAGGSDGGGAYMGDVPCPECLNCELGLSVKLQSIMVSAPPLFGVPAALLGGALVDCVGRRKGLALGSLLMLLGWITIFATPLPDATARAALAADALPPQLLTPTALLLFGGRILNYIALNVQVIAGTVWIAESCPSGIRGGVMTLVSFGWCGGTLGVYALGDVLAWRALSFASAVLALVTLLWCALFVESPRWLASHVGMAAAERSLRALRPEAARLEGTLAEIAAGLRAPVPSAEAADAREARAPVRICPIIKATVLMAAVPLSGVLVIGTFAGEIIGGIFPAHRNAAAVVLPLAAAVGVGVVSVGVDRFGRRVMLLFSCVGMVFCFAVMALYYRCHERGVWSWGFSQSEWEWAALTALVLCKRDRLLPSSLHCLNHPKSDPPRCALCSFSDPRVF